MSIETLAIVFVAISIGAFSKGLVGLGLPMISIPILAGFIGVEHAVVVMTIPVAASNLVIVWSYRRLAEMVPGLGLALACAAAGAALGAYGLVAFDERVLLWVMTVWLAVYLIYRSVKPEFRLAGRAARIASPILATAAGIAQGATGMSAPLIATWIHSYRLQAEAYVFGVSALFLSISGAHLIAVAGLRPVRPGTRTAGTVGADPGRHLRPPRHAHDATDQRQTVRPADHRPDRGDGTEAGVAADRGRLNRRARSGQPSQPALRRPSRKCSLSASCLYRNQMFSFSRYRGLRRLHASRLARAWSISPRWPRVAAISR